MVAVALLLVAGDDEPGDGGEPLCRFVDVPVTLPELVIGASIEVPTPDGPVTMKVPPR